MSKVAVVFWRATGNTETMANCVAEGANGTIVPCGEMNAAKLAEFDAVAFGCPAMGSEELEESEFEPFFSSGEGSLSGKQPNTIIYATSNRRHLIKENFSDRENDVNKGDTMQEQLSLSARFGLTITFLNPDIKEYLDIVEKLACDRHFKEKDDNVDKLHYKDDQ